MLGRHSLLWNGGGFAVLIGVLSGCSSTPPVAELPPPPVTVSQPVFREVPIYDDYEGRITAKPIAEIRARVKGHLIAIDFQDGQIVKEGDLLFEIDPRPFQAELEGAEAQKAAAESAYKLAKATVVRDEPLVGRGVSKQDFDVSVGKLGVSQGDLRKALAAIDRVKLDLEYTRIRAPITGKISRALVDVGNLINAGGGETLLTTITAIDPIYVSFNVDERNLLGYLREHHRDGDKPSDTEVKAGRTQIAAQAMASRAFSLSGAGAPAWPGALADLRVATIDPYSLRVGTLKELRIPVEVALDGDKGYPHLGLLDFADNQVNPSTGTILVRGVLPNKKQILGPGMRARVRVPVGQPRKRVMITERAIGTDQTRRFVYVVNEENTVERRDVTLGRLADGLQIIQEGLEPDDWVIVNGIQRVRDGIKVDPKRGPMPGAPAKATNEKSKS
jgi:multidrug efflux pump subunit AcrA (membrane-fusion protein)